MQDTVTKMDGLLDRIDQINDPSEFKDIYKRIQEILVDELRLSAYTIGPHLL